MATSNPSLTISNHYHVFLSFRGSDVRESFADVLYDRLRTAGFRVFRDGEEIKGGEEINECLIKGIHRSDILMPIISPNYAESSACLLELAYMSRLKQKEIRKVIPIFFNAKSTILETFPAAFIKKVNEKPKLAKKISEVEGCNDKKNAVATWMNALSAFAEQPPKYHSQSKGKYWTQVMFEVVSDVRAHLTIEDVSVPDKFVWVDHDVQKMMTMLGVVYRDGKAHKLEGIENSRMVAITGAQGIGKTTLAKVTFNILNHLFDACSFLEDVHCKSESWPKKLLRDLDKRYSDDRPMACINILKSAFKEKRVLIVLDGVDSIGDIQAEGRNWFDPRWFSSQSRFILTTHKENLLTANLFKEAKRWNVGEMPKKLAVQLLLKHICQDNNPQVSSEFMSLVIYVIGLKKDLTPRSIERIGKRLHEMHKDSRHKGLEEIVSMPTYRV